MEILVSRITETIIVFFVFYSTCNDNSAQVLIELVSEQSLTIFRKSIFNNIKNKTMKSLFISQKNVLLVIMANNKLEALEEKLDTEVADSYFV